MARSPLSRHPLVSAADQSRPSRRGAVRTHQPDETGARTHACEDDGGRSGEAETAAVRLAGRGPGWTSLAMAGERDEQVGMPQDAVTPRGTPVVAIDEQIVPAHIDGAFIAGLSRAARTSAGCTRVWLTEAPRAAHRALVLRGFGAGRVWPSASPWGQASRLDPGQTWWTSTAAWARELRGVPVSDRWRWSDPECPDEGETRWGACGTATWESRC
jgi:hypothetical protein